LIIFKKYGYGTPKSKNSQPRFRCRSFGLANLLGRLVSAAGRIKFAYRIPNIKTNWNNQNSN
jgi:hypothetical protein